EWKDADLVIVSYARLRLDADFFARKEFAAIALDEAQMIKNPDSQIAKVCCSLQAPIRLALTGTPVENRFEDLFSLFHFLQPDLLEDQQVARARSNPLILQK